MHCNVKLDQNLVLCELPELLDFLSIRISTQRIDHRLKASLSHLVRPHFKIKSQKRARDGAL